VLKMAKSLQENIQAVLDGGKRQWESGDDSSEELDFVKPIEEKGSRFQNKKASDEPSSVMYIGHLPRGFEELELRGFFLQFGELEKLKVSRSKKTGRSKGYAFLKFADPEVAKVASDAMNGYFLLEKRLVCHIVPPDKIHLKMFTGKFVKKNWREISSSQANRSRTAEQWEKFTDAQIARENAKRSKLKVLGIDYNLPSLLNAKVDEEDQWKQRKVSEGVHDDAVSLKSNKKKEVSSQREKKTITSSKRSTKKSFKKLKK